MSTKQKKIVLTGGPCAGKTTLTQVIAKAFPKHIVIVPESASLLFSGGFPRWEDKECQRSTQRAIFQVQTELENTYAAHYPQKILVLDRGTVDGAAYWPEGSDQYFSAMGTSLEAELQRYEKVIYLESASAEDYAIHRMKNINRKETWEEAKALDAQSYKLWSRHPSILYVPNQRAFSTKVSEVLGEIGLIIPSSGSV